MLLNTIVREDVAPQWRHLGEQLLKDAMARNLNIIEEKIKDDVKKSFDAIFAHWLDDYFNATWNKMEDALKQRGYSELAETVKKNDTIKG